MATSVLSLIQVYCPGLYSDANRDTFITVATDRTSQSFYGSNYNLAIALMACHDWAIANRPGGSYGAVGSLANMREGDLSIGYSSSSSTGGGDLDQTSFGKKLQQLKKSTLPGVSCTGADNATEFEE